MRTDRPGIPRLIGKMLSFLGLNTSMEDYLDDDDEKEDDISEQAIIEKEESDYQHHTMPGDGD